MSTTSNTNEIRDFGEKIGGARKDLYREGGISISSLDLMNEAEMKTLVRRDTVWPLPNAIKAVNSGLPPFVVYWAREVRKMTYGRPRVIAGKTIREMCERYITDLRKFRSMVEDVKTEDGIDSFYAGMFQGQHGSWKIDQLSYAIQAASIVCAVRKPGFPMSIVRLENGSLDLFRPS